MHGGYCPEQKLRGWFTGRLPQDWFTGPVEVAVDREEITVVGTLALPAVPKFTTSGGEELDIIPTSP